MKSGGPGIAFRAATSGLWCAWREEPSLRFHFLAAYTVLVLGSWLGLSALEMALVALASGLVVVAEVANTAVEALTDLVSPGFHPLARTAKNVAAGAVLAAALVALGVGALLFGPRLPEAAGVVGGRLARPGAATLLEAAVFLGLLGCWFAGWGRRRRSQQATEGEEG